jgi:myo-inositol-1-phosphate synthase
VPPAKGRLGVLLPGLGAVATTFIAGVEAVRRGNAAPIGSLTQMATIRLGKRTDKRSPLIKDFVPLADLKDLVFGAWDPIPDNAYVAAQKAGVLEQSHLEPLKAFLSKIKPMPAVFDHPFRQNPQLSERNERDFHRPLAQPSKGAVHRNGHAEE